MSTRVQNKLTFAGDLAFFFFFPAMFWTGEHHWAVANAVCIVYVGSWMFYRIIWPGEKRQERERERACDVLVVSSLPELFNRWAIIHPEDPSKAWSGSRWVPSAVNVQICNFSTSIQAIAFAKTDPLLRRFPR